METFILSNWDISRFEDLFLHKFRDFNIFEGQFFSCGVVAKNIFSWL